MPRSESSLNVTAEELTEGVRIPLEPGDTGTIFVADEGLKKIYIIEFEDMLFHLNSAVPLPLGVKGKEVRDDNPSALFQQQLASGLVVIGATLAYAYHCDAADLPKQLYLAGHTDTSGENDYNIKLSCLRGNALSFLLAGDRDGWIGQFENEYKDGVRTQRSIDVQMILNYAAVSRSWPCEAPLNDTMDTATQASLKRFQTAYNSDGCVKQGTIKEDGILGPQTWGAIYDLYEAEVKNLLLPLFIEMGADIPDDDGKPQFISEMAQLRSRLVWGKGDHKRSVLPCGEYHPIDQAQRDNYRSQANRRTELFFMDSDETALLDCLRTGACTKEACAFYEARKDGRFEMLYFSSFVEEFQVEVVE